MKSLINIMKQIRLTPIMLYSLILIIDNFLSLPFVCNINRGAIGNIISLSIIILSIIVFIIERFISFKVTYNKKLWIIELVLIAFTTLAYWCVCFSLPLPTLRRL